jgi:hypothetical protein
MTPRLEAGAVSVWPGFRLVVGSAGIGGLGLADEIHREGPTRAAVPHLSGTIRNRKHHQQSSPRRVPLVPNPSAHNIRRSLAQRSPHLPPIDALACDRKSISRIDRSCSPLQAGNPETPTNYLSQVINSRIDIHLVRSQEIQKANAPVSTGLTKAQQHLVFTDTLRRGASFNRIAQTCECLDRMLSVIVVPRHPIVLQECK